ncbi:hypothetical protein LOK49_LG02G00966 [Camellia lanceoleosa]|uniref:Uncharacterized protein n=1 Tax=Camellia lanceoleosa TaxID=1840588 RepID=A0ACC0IM07_9ERIC|nr:hypothetical protein LOK49_LG02G00966 [Camellia lanceoleosa]
MAARKPGFIALFDVDVDGTLTAPPKVVTPDMLKFMQELRKVVTVGVVGGSDLVKISEQLGNSAINDYDYEFAENGLVAYKDGKLIGTQVFLRSYLGEEKLKVRPFSCSFLHPESQRDHKIRKVHIRPKMLSLLREKFAHLNLTFSIGGQISFDVFPQGWDKTCCLRYVDDFHEIHFFGDGTYKGGNDHEIYESERTMGHTVIVRNPHVHFDQSWGNIALGMLMFRMFIISQFHGVLIGCTNCTNISFLWGHHAACKSFRVQTDLGLRLPWLEGEKYLSIVDEFMEAIHSRWPKAIVQGTAVVAQAGLLGTVRAQYRPLTDFMNQKIVVVGAGSVGLGVFDNAAQAVSRMAGAKAKILGFSYLIKM